MIDTIIFDLDGTLLNTLDDLWASVNYSLAQHRLPPRSKSEIRSFLGNGVKVLIEKSVPSLTSEPKVMEVLSTFRKYYLIHAMDNTGPYDGIPELLSSLHSKGFKTAIVSNKPDAAVQELYDSLFKDNVDIAIGERPALRRKPAPDMVLAALEILGSDVNHSIYVGDSEVDMATARNSNMHCVSVSWGFRDRSFLVEAGAETIIDKPEELFLSLKFKI